MGIVYQLADMIGWQLNSMNIYKLLHNIFQTIDTIYMCAWSPIKVLTETGRQGDHFMTTLFTQHPPGRIGCMLIAILNNEGDQLVPIVLQCIS